MFAAAFGCPIHVYEEGSSCALPCVTTAEEADRLPEPSLDAPPLRSIFGAAEMLRARLGPEVPIGVPDIQSPFDIAALVWRKQDLFVALHENPQAVQRLVAKCHRLLAGFLAEYRRCFAPVNLAHVACCWAPPELGCWLSEDEAGSLSAAMFERFCLPTLADLSTAFGGLFMHCCANADHQYANFLKIPNLRGLNRVFQAPGPRPAITTFSGRTVLVVAWTEEDAVKKMLDMAHPNTRFLFSMPRRPLEEQKPIYEQLRALCSRQKEDYG